jgi:lysophospholipase L1-like esterase
VEIVRWRRYVALGDSFTEGVGDPYPLGGERGWADRVALELGSRDTLVEYANLAVRGRLLDQIVQEQVPCASALRPDLVTINGGINDALRRTWDLEAMTRHLEDGITGLRATGADVVFVGFGRPSRRSRLMRTVESRLAGYRQEIHAVAQRHGARVVDFWDQTVFDDPRFWSDDRLHLNPVGHQRVASAVLDALGVSQDQWWEPLPVARRPSPVARAGRNARWAGKHLAPWLGRRVAGRSSSDGRNPKRPEPAPVAATARQPGRS